MKVKQGQPVVVVLGPYQNPDNTFPNGPLEAAQVTLSMNGGAFGAKSDPSPAVADHSGMYLVPLDGHDTNVVGSAVLIGVLPDGMVRRLDFDVVP